MNRTEFNKQLAASKQQLKDRQVLAVNINKQNKDEQSISDVSPFGKRKRP